MFPWFFISDSLSSATSSVIESSFLVKKIVFRVEILPIVKIMSALVVHIFFVVGLFAMFAYYGYSVSIYNFQILYYFFAMICLSLGISWLTSSLTVFLRDVGNSLEWYCNLDFGRRRYFGAWKWFPKNFTFSWNLIRHTIWLKAIDKVLSITNGFGSTNTWRRIFGYLRR